MKNGVGSGRDAQDLARVRAGLGPVPEGESVVEHPRPSRNGQHHIIDAPVEKTGGKRQFDSLRFGSR